MTGSLFCLRCTCQFSLPPFLIETLHSLLIIRALALASLWQKKFQCDNIRSNCPLDIRFWESHSKTNGINNSKKTGIINFFLINGNLFSFYIINIFNFFLISKKFGNSFKFFTNMKKITLKLKCVILYSIY